MEGIDIDFIYSVIRLITFILIGVLLLRWMEKKKGWTYSVKTDLYLIISWNLILFALLFVLDLIYQVYFFPLSLLTSWVFLIYLILAFLISFFINLYIGYLLFKAFHKENKRDNVIILFLIVIVEFIIDNLILYPFAIFLG
jgi:hypothetical protein